MHAVSGSADVADVADRTWPTSRRSRLELAVVPSAVRLARHWTADQLASAGPGGQVLDAELIDTAVLVVSELVTNAIRAATLPAAGSPAAGPVPLAERILSFADLPLPALPAGLPSMPVIADPVSEPPRVCLVITRFTALVRIEVQDSSALPLPAPQKGDDDDESGRGLAIVAVLAQSWGWQPARAGKVVWCELSCLCLAGAITSAAKNPGPSAPELLPSRNIQNGAFVLSSAALPEYRLFTDAGYLPR